MELTKIEIRTDKALTEKAKTLYLQAFPKEERIPWWILRLNARRKGIHLTAYLDGETFCGFTASVTVEGMEFILFLAIPEALRGKGCGSAILSAVKAETDCVALNIETLDPEAPNYRERVKRFAFYQKNGFYDTAYHVWEVGGMFRVLATQPVLDVKRYKKVFRKLSLGLWDVRLQAVEDDV